MQSFSPFVCLYFGPNNLLPLTASSFACPQLFRVRQLTITLTRSVRQETSIFQGNPCFHRSCSHGPDLPRARPTKLAIYRLLVRLARNFQLAKSRREGRYTLVVFRVFMENSRKIHELQCFISRRLLIFFLLGKIPKKQLRDLRTKDIGQAHGVSRVRRVSPLPTVRGRPGSSPASFSSHGWSQKEPGITRALFVQSTKPTHRHRRGQHAIASHFLAVDGFVAPQVVYSFALARYGRPSWSQGTSSSTIKRIPFARAAGFDYSIGCTSVGTS